MVVLKGLISISRDDGFIDGLDDVQPAGLIRRDWWLVRCYSGESRKKSLTELNLSIFSILSSGKVQRRN